MLVHLRVGGGTAGTTAAGIYRSGASPRGRRNPPRRRLDASSRRCISAWAEEPSVGWSRKDDRRVHLRVGGGTSPSLCQPATRRGASPRGRRNRLVDRIGTLDERCISAWAEEPVLDCPRCVVDWVHLRVGGGTHAEELVNQLSRGASPRGRRNPGDLDLHGRGIRCISAWAEEPAASIVRRRTSAVHLRVGGGTSRGRWPADAGSGASPRGRRNPALEPTPAGLPRCISAWAEEPRVADS